MAAMLQPALRSRPSRSIALCVSVLLCSNLMFGGEAKSCICPQVYMPVCGEDGTTYSNSCGAACSSVKVASQGACEAPSPAAADCICTAIYAPVCRKDGLTLANDCGARCNGGEIDYQGECVTDPTPQLHYCGCPKDLKRVCGSDKKTYANSCHAKCAKVDIASQGGCRVIQTLQPTKPCACPRDLNPVCGADNTTYNNDCLAGCAKVKVASSGACRQHRLIPDPDCICTALYDPICGKDSKTWGNECSAQCAGAEVAYYGPCISPGPAPSPGLEPACACPFNYNPVCGKDGKTYGNTCAAKCENVEVVGSTACDATTKLTLEPAPLAESCPCPMASLSSRVCGINPVTNARQTYSSACRARCAKVTVMRRGTCSRTFHIPPIKTPAPVSTCPCPRNLEPVCGTVPFNPAMPAPTNITFANLCEANCSNATIIDKNGACQMDPSIRTLPPSAASCSCIREDNPVCDIISNITYPSPCEAACGRAGLTIPGACASLPPDSHPNACVCTEQFDPVCANGETYSNECQAACAKVTTYTKGACKIA